MFMENSSRWMRTVSRHGKKRFYKIDEEQEEQRAIKRIKYCHDLDHRRDKERLKLFV